MNGFFLTILSLAAVASANVDYALKCNREELGILWPSYYSSSEFYICERVGAPKITLRCAPGEMFTFVLQKCSSATRYIPPPPLSILPTSAPSTPHVRPNVQQTKPYKPHHQQHHHFNMDIVPQLEHVQPQLQQPHQSLPMPYYPADLAVQYNAPVKPDKIERPAILDMLNGMPSHQTVAEPEHHPEIQNPPVLNVQEPAAAVPQPPITLPASETKPVMPMLPVKPAPAVPPMPPTPEPTPPVVVTTVAPKKQPSRPAKPSKPSKPTPKKPASKQTTTKQPAAPTKRQAPPKPTKAAN